VTDPLDLAVVTGSVAVVGMTGLTLGGGYGSLSGRFGLAIDNVVAAEVVLADGRIVVAKEDSEEELFWALRGGGGNFGVVTAMDHRLHKLPSVRSGTLIYPFSEARKVLEGYAEIAACAPDELTAQLVLVGGPDGAPVVMIVPMWCGAPETGEAQVEPLQKLGTVLADTVDVMPYRTSLTVFDPYLVNRQRVIVETCWLPGLDKGSIDAFIEAMEAAVSPACAIFTHEFRGAASLVPVDATAFGLRRDHVLLEIFATFIDQPNKCDEQPHLQWARSALQGFDALALPGGYANLLAAGDLDRAAKSFGNNAGRLVKAKHCYDPDNLFRSGIPLPMGEAQ
jgi:FAD/FMN-containing dehydrogenase